MKQSTGVIRRIDELGRIVIPKGLRDQLKITEGQPFEIFLTENGFVLDVYQPKPTKEDIAKKWLNDNRLLMETYHYQFFHYGKHTCCVAIIPCRNQPVAVGYTACASNDEYSESVGEVISFCRAINKVKMIPKEFFE